MPRNLHSFCPEPCTLAPNPAQWDTRFLGKPFHTLHTGMECWKENHLVLTTVYNCAQIKLTTPRYGGSLWEMLLSIPTGDGHDQEQDSEYHTRISKPEIGRASCRERV